MISAYALLIRNKKKTIDDIPARDRQAVLGQLEDLGLDGYGNPTL